MKIRGVLVSTILILTLLAGSSMAWFTGNPSGIENQFNIGTVKVKIIEKFTSKPSYTVGVCQKKQIKVKSLGTKNAYVRVRLIPEWSDPNLSVSNVQINFSQTNKWIKVGDYYYFPYYLKEKQETSVLVESVTFTSLGSEYHGETFTLKVVTEGVQISNDAWKNIWGLTTLPFSENQPWR